MNKKLNEQLWNYFIGQFSNRFRWEIIENLKNPLSIQVGWRIKQLIKEELNE